MNGAAPAFSDLMDEGAITRRAELTLARCYADFDLAKKDLKERLFESLALMDTERSELLLRKYKQFQPTFSNAESDILGMRLVPERRRHNVVGERLKALELLYELVGFINAQNGGTNGEPGSGMSGFVNGAALPTFEEIYLVEVIAALIDSSLPMRAGEGANRLGDYVKPQDYNEDAEVVLGRFDPNSGIHPSLFTLHAGSPVQPSLSATSPRRMSGLGPGTLPPTHSLPLTYGTNTLQPIAPSTPSPAYLFLLMCLSPSVFKFKETREALAHWAKLCGLTEDAADVALRMVGVDPRHATYSGRGAMKAGDVLTEAQLLSLSQSGQLKTSAFLNTAARVHPTASRPLSSVILAPVSLGDWESLKRGERVKQNARELARRVRAVRELTTSSNASTRSALGKATGVSMRAPPVYSPKPLPYSNAADPPHADEVDRIPPRKFHTTGESHTLLEADRAQRVDLHARKN